MFWGAMRRILSVFIDVEQALRIGNMLLNMFFYLAGRKMSVNFTPKIKSTDSKTIQTPIIQDHESSSGSPSFGACACIVRHQDGGTRTDKVGPRSSEIRK